MSQKRDMGHPALVVGLALREADPWLTTRKLCPKEAKSLFGNQRVRLGSRSLAMTHREM